MSVSSAVPVVVMTCRAADSTNLQCYHSATVERSSLESTFPFSKVCLQGLRASAPRTYTLQARDTDSPNRGRTTIAALPPRRPASYTRYNTGGSHRMATRWYTTERTTPENPRTQWRSPIRGTHGGQGAATLPVWVDAPTRTGRLQRAGPITLGRGARHGAGTRGLEAQVSRQIQ